MKRIFVSIVACCVAVAAVLLPGRAALAAAPRTAQEFFQVFQDRNDWTWSGGDNVTSLRASNGYTYWSFGDTALGEEDRVTGAYRPGWTMVANSILVQRDGTFSAATTTAPAIPGPGGTDRYWAQGMFEGNGRLYVLAQRVRPKEGNPNQFDLRGVELARFGFNANGTLTFQGMANTPSSGKVDPRSPATAQYAADAVVVGGYVYLFGYANTGDVSFPQHTYVAVAPVSSVESPSTWQFFAGGVWRTDMAAATAVVTAQVSSVRMIGGSWVLAYKPWNGYGDTVHIERRTNLFGTPVGTTTIHSPRGTTPGGHRYRTYAPQVHPEQSLTSGRLLVSIAWNGENLYVDTAGDADLYKPRFYEVSVP